MHVNLSGSGDQLHFIMIQIQQSKIGIDFLKHLRIQAESWCSEPLVESDRDFYIDLPADLVSYRLGEAEVLIQGW